MDESTDPLVNAVRDIGSTVGNAAEGVFDWFAKAARGGVQDTDPPAEKPTNGESH